MGRSKVYKERQAANKSKKSTAPAGTIVAQQFSAPRRKIIIAVDYGTTYSGVAYHADKNRNTSDIKFIMQWPGEDAKLYKTPTRIAYATENDNFGAPFDKVANNKIGFEVNSRQKSYAWTKLLLDGKTRITEFDHAAATSFAEQGIMQLPKTRDAAGVCEDYLREIHNHVLPKIKLEVGEEKFNDIPIEYWITLPAIWSDAAKDATLRAARKAGFANRVNDSIHTIAEPEAAAIATLKRHSAKSALNPVEPNENVLVCDCGGGTVDITIYKICAIEPNLEFDELCAGIGGKCGATFIDRNLYNLMSRRFGIAFDSLPSEMKAPGSRFMSCFEVIKKSFGRNDDYSIKEVEGLDMICDESSFWDKRFKAVRLTYNDLKALFDPVVEDVIKLVENQIREARIEENAMIGRIVLVGGFGESPYLGERLRQWGADNGGIQVLCPEQAQAAILRGAVMRGLNQIAPRTRKSRAYYGFGCCLPFREGIDAEEDKTLSPINGIYYCEGRISWEIKKNEAISDDTHRSSHIEVEYDPNEVLTCSTKLYSTTRDDVERMEDADMIGIVSVAISPPHNFGKAWVSTYVPELKKHVQKIDVEIQAVFGNKGNNLTFRCLINGKILDSHTTKIEYV